MSATRPDVHCERHHAGLVVSDVAAAVEFYTTRLGIQELKKKHGIDYDSHGSYRFVEE